LHAGTGSGQIVSTGARPDLVRPLTRLALSETGHVLRERETQSNCLPLICAGLGHDFDEISQQALPFVREYLQFGKDSVKAAGSMSDGRRQNVARILETLLAKLRYDTEFNPDSDNDEDQVRRPSLHRRRSLVCGAVAFR